MALLDAETTLIPLANSFRVFNVVRKSDGRELPYIAKKYRGIQDLEQEYNKLEILKSVKFVSKVVKKYETYLLLRKIPGIELFDYLTMYSIPHAEILTIAVKLIKLIEEIHNHEVSHGDIKLENIIYNPKTNDVYLIDFGCDRTSLYAPPEIVYAHESMDYEVCEYKNDVWCYGVCLYILINRTAPFSRVEHILHKEPAYTSVFLEDLIKMCLIKNPSKRASVTDIISYFGCGENPGESPP